MTRPEFIVAAARFYLGQREKKGNKGFESAAFEKEMKSVGWYVGAPWCMFFVKLIWKKAYKGDPRLLDVVTRMLNGSALMSLNNMENNGTFTVSDQPLPGSIAIWRQGISTSGHAAIVTPFSSINTFQTVEGNTNAHGSREGEVVAEKLRTLKRDFKAAGLNLEGFINPIEI